MPGGAPRGTRVYPTAPRTRVGPAPDGACTGQLCTRWEGHGPGACPGLRMGQASTGLRRYGPGVHREGVHPAEPVRGMCAAGAYPAGSAPGRRPPRRGCARRGPHPAGPAPCRRAPGVRALMGQTPAWGRVYGPGAHLFPAGMCAVRVYLAGPAPGGRVPGGARTRQGMHRAGVHPAGRARARCLPGAAYGAGVHPAARAGRPPGGRVPGGARTRHVCAASPHPAGSARARRAPGRGPQVSGAQPGARVRAGHPPGGTAAHAGSRGVGHPSGAPSDVSRAVSG